MLFIHYLTLFFALHLIAPLFPFFLSTRIEWCNYIKYIDHQHLDPSSSILFLLSSETTLYNPQICRAKLHPPYPAFNHLGTQIRDKWRRINDKMRHGTAPAMRSKIIQSRDKFEAFVKDIDLYHVNEPQPIGQPKRNRLHEADARTRSDILSMLQGLDTILATGK